MSKKSSNKYFDAFDEIFKEVEQGKTIWCYDVLKDERLPSVGEATKKNNLKSYIDENPKVIEKVLGI